MEASEKHATGSEGSELEPRPHAVDIYERVCDDTIEELGRPWSSLVYSGLFAGFTIGAAPLAYVLALVALGGDSDADKFVAALLYPIGYIAVIIGRAQFFTENTLYPVMVTMRRPEFLKTSARLWAIVLATNLIGALLFAMLVMFTGAFGDQVQAEFVAEGVGDTSGAADLDVLERRRHRLAARARRLAGGGRGTRDRADPGHLGDHAARRPWRIRPLHRDDGRGLHARCSRARSPSATSPAGSSRRSSATPPEGS